MLVRTAVAVALAVPVLALAGPVAASGLPTPPTVGGAADPCAPVDGETPLMCQGQPVPASVAGSGARPVAEAEPAVGPAELPRTGGRDVAGLAAAGAASVLLGAGALLAGRRRPVS